MLPMFVKNARQGMTRVPDAFCCRTDRLIAKGRRKGSFI